jgi:S-adenosylmethionine:tRNA ribosyltransferase-isomerase
MLVLSRARGNFQDDEFQNFAKYVKPGDCLVLNDTRVFPARLHGHRNTKDGAVIEVFLLRSIDEQRGEWRALVKPAKRAKTGDHITFSPELSAEIISEGDYGERTIRLESQRDLTSLLEELGETPLPPYIHRQATREDRNRYQTVFAKNSGSIAAPTAGLHFTEKMLEACKAAGATTAHVTLHVGLGTFAPLRGTDLSEIQLHTERFEVLPDECDKMRAAKRVVCVGTTSVRTVETASLSGVLNARTGETNLFIYPGFHFRTVGGMLTNFHLPESSLLMLVSAFAGRELTLAAYEHAVRERYRFFSYGDCMLIE